MFRRKLLALNYIDANNFNLNDENEFRNAIVWLEDQQIRHYKLNDRTPLRNINDSSWEKVYQKYLKDLECPIVSTRREEQFEWLLTFSISLLFDDNIDKYNSNNLAKEQSSAPNISSDNPLDNLDFQSAEFIQGVNSLASLLQIDQQPDHLLTLKAVSKFVVSRLNQKAIKEPNSVVSKGPIFPFEDADSGFNLGDPLLNKAAKVLRLLYTNNLRQLQTEINECIVAVQTLTANPKTDTKLGQMKTGLALLVLYAVLDAVNCIMFHLPPNTMKCLREELQANVLVTGEYEVSESIQQQVDYIVRDSKGHVLSQKQGINAGKFSFVTETFDAFEICFLSKVPTQVRGQVQEVSLKIKRGIEAKSYEGIAEAAKLKPMEVELKRLEDLSEDIVKDFSIMRKREEEMRNTNESTNSRVLGFSIFSMCCLLGLATWQVLYLRKFFQSKKLIE